MPDTEFISILNAGTAGSDTTFLRAGAKPLPDVLPILGLSDLVLFPGMVAPLLVESVQSIKLIDDVVGGDFILTGSAQVSFPVVGDSLRGVVFGDAGTVNPDFEVGKIRSSVGTGIRLTLLILGQTPIAIDLAVPLTKDGKDDTQVISFSLGFSR